MATDHPEVRFVEDRNLKRLLLRFALADPPYLASDVFEVYCAPGLALSCRKRPVLSLALRRLRSAPTLSDEYNDVLSEKNRCA
jgi:hypothetical protein